MIYLIIVIAALFSAICFLISSVFKLEDKLVHTEIKVDRLSEYREQEVPALSNRITEIAKELESIKENPKQTTDVVEDQLQAAREKVFTEWIQSIANYDPYGGGK